jgi:hypothetical protein
MQTNNFINLETFRGDDVTLNFAIKDAYGVPIDITDWIFYITIKRKLTLTEPEEPDDDANLKKRCSSFGSLYSPVDEKDSHGN